MPTSEELKRTFVLPLVPGTTCGEELLRRNYHRTQILGGKGEKAVLTEAVPIDHNLALNVVNNSSVNAIGLGSLRGVSNKGVVAGTVAGVSRSINGVNGTLRAEQGRGYNLPRNKLSSYYNTNYYESGRPISHSMFAEQQNANAVVDGAEGTYTNQTSASLDGRVLRYYGYFREGVQESQVEKERIRKIAVLYYLEDGTMSVVEPHQDNSGITQGTIVKRHRIPKPDGTGAITFDMINVGGELTFYGRTYFIVGVDEFTAEFLASIGVQVPPHGSYSYPRDVHEEVRTRPRKVFDVPSVSATIDSTVKLTRNQVKAAMKFFENDRDVLKLHAIWDDSAMLYGGVHHFDAYYFLADDTFEVVENDEPNSGRDPFPSYIRRQKIYKTSEYQRQQQQPQSAERGGIFAGTASSSSPSSPSYPSYNGGGGGTGKKALTGTNPNIKKFTNLTASLTFKGKDEDIPYYTDEDIWIGSVINMFGRDLIITDYNQHTRDHLRKKFGITEYAPITANYVPKPRPPITHVPPPYNGFGDEEDSLSSWRKLDLKPPKKDITKLRKFGDNVVKFILKLDNNSRADEIRRFVLTCHLSDDTISIFEPVQRNSGIVGGKFLQRQKVKNPLTGKSFVASDFHVGGRTVINGFPFVILASDEHSISYMEQQSASFPKSDINLVAKKLQAMLMSAATGLAQALHDADNEGSGTLDYKQFLSTIRRLGLDDDLSEQEILTILRYFDFNGEGYISYDEFISRFIPEGVQIGNDERSWREIYKEELSSSNLSESTGITPGCTVGPNVIISGANLHGIKPRSYPQMAQSSDPTASAGTPSGTTGSTPSYTSSPSNTAGGGGSSVIGDEGDAGSLRVIVDRQKAKVDNTTTAYAAKAFLEQYEERRVLFLKEFRSICDYSPDEKISEREFRMCCVNKLKVNLTPAQLDALASALFPAGARRITFEEFVRIINSNSNRDYNLKQLIARR